MTLNDFRIMFPEFATVPSAQVSVFLDMAAEHVNVTVWGERYDEGHGFKAAELLALSPSGMGTARVSGPNSGSQYGEAFRTALYAVTTGLRGVV